MRKLVRILIDFFRRFPELIGLPFAVAAFYFAPILITKIDSTAGVVDTGLLQFMVLAPSYVLLANLMTFIGIKLNFPNLYKSYLNGFPERADFWQFYAIYTTLIVAFVLSLIALV
jgi:hypothetical protein